MLILLLVSKAEHIVLCLTWSEDLINITLNVWGKETFVIFMKVKYTVGNSISIERSMSMLIQHMDA